MTGSQKCERECVCWKHQPRTEVHLKNQSNALQCKPKCTCKRHENLIRSPRSEETKRKISVSLTGIPYEEGRAKAALGRIPWNKGLTDLSWPSGSNHGNWKGGDINKLISPQALRLWRKLVFERDLYTCQLCGKYGGVLHADHIIPRWKAPHLIFVVTNGRTLCEPCHRDTDTYGHSKLTSRPKEFQLPLGMVV